MRDDDLTRRELLLAAAGGGAAVWIGCGGEVDPAIDGGVGSDGAAPPADSGAALDGGGVDAALPDGGALDAPPTPACLETDSNILGPAYLEGAPIRRDGELNVLGWPGRRLDLTGRVVSARGCVPLADAELDLWQADDAGCYDGSPIGCGPLTPDWPLRGRVATDAEGRYAFTTIYPGLYPGRTRHIHVIVRARGHRPLTTQIYFAGEPANATDGAILPSLTIELATGPGGALSGAFDIVLAPL